MSPEEHLAVLEQQHEDIRYEQEMLLHPNPHLAADIREYVHRIHGSGGLDDLEPAGPGTCDDCTRDDRYNAAATVHTHRRCYGTLELCKHHADLRMRSATQHAPTEPPKGP